MEYLTVFDIATAGFKDWKFPAFGLIFVAIGIVFIMNPRLTTVWTENPPRPRKWFPRLFLGFAILWTVTVFVWSFNQYWYLSHAEADGRAAVAEGVVANFKPMPVNGHALERFCVQQKCFEYSDFVVNGGFNNTSSHGGPIREGLPVRVTYVGGTIIKLEVGR